MAVSVGGSFFWVAIMATALTLGTLKLVAVLEGKVVGSGDFRRINLIVDSRDRVPQVVMALTEAAADVGRITVRRLEAGFAIGLSLGAGRADMLQALASLPGVEAAEWADSE
jgi:hypothetical protein